MSNTSDLAHILARLGDLHPRKIDLSLGRMERLLAGLGNPERHLPPVIHIAGTNGKGSTQAYLRAMAEAAGKRVHAYTSPHLVRFNERIRIAGQLIDDSSLSEILLECERVNAGAPITFFEITNAAAFLAFARASADLCLLETGLGGRLDSTNVIARPRLCVITPVSMDHMDFLGPTLAGIADAKAGILKPGAPAVIGPQPPEAEAVIEAEAARLGAPQLRWGREWFSLRDKGRVLFKQGPAVPAGMSPSAVCDAFPAPSLPGPHQYQNAGAAIMAARTIGLPDAAIATGLRTAVWPARMQRLAGGPLNDLLPPSAELWLDGGHNAAAAAALAATLPDDGRDLFLVMGMLATKDAAGFLHAFAGRVAGLAAVDIPGEHAARPASELASIATGAGIPAVASANVAEALRSLGARAGGCRVLICGSLYLAGHVLAEQGAIPD